MLTLPFIPRRHRSLIPNLVATMKHSHHYSSSNSNEDKVYSMAAASASPSTDYYNDTHRKPSSKRDGFHLVPNHPIIYDIDYSKPPHNISFQDITYQISTTDRCARIAFNRPHVLHAFRPITINEIRKALDIATDDIRVAVILIDSETKESSSTASTTTPTLAFCAGGDQSVRSDEGGYHDGSETVPRLRVLDLQVQMRRCPKPILAIVRGYAIGGGHILHMVADLTLATTDAVFFPSRTTYGIL